MRARQSCTPLWFAVCKSAAARLIYLVPRASRSHSCTTLPLVVQMLLTGDTTANTNANNTCNLNNISEPGQWVLWC
jgi:hypothetical protein